MNLAERGMSEFASDVLTSGSCRHLASLAAAVPIRSWKLSSRILAYTLGVLQKTGCSHSQKWNA